MIQAKRFTLRPISGRLLIVVIALSVCSVRGAGATSTPAAAPTLERMSLLPLAFTRNEGQWDERARFQAKGRGVTMWFTAEGVLYHMTRRIEEPKDWTVRESLEEMPTDRPTPGTVEHRVVRATLVGANPAPVVVPENEMEYKCNWFIGNDPEKWHTDVPNYSSIVYKNVYSGIDVRYRGNGKQIEHDFIVSPGTDPSIIELRYDGAQSVDLDRNGDLIIVTDFGELIERIPKTYQERNGILERVSCCYEITDNNTVRFLLDQGHDAELALVIDPVLEYSTFIGGSGGDFGTAIAVDSDGSVLVTGGTEGSGFPTLNAYDASFNSSSDIFISKLNSSGSGLVFSTYLGGNASEQGQGIAVDDLGDAYVVGLTSSSNFPLQNEFDGALAGLEDAVVAKLSAAGNTLMYSTYYGGNGEDYGYGIALDGDGSAYITGLTASPESGFPLVNPYDSERSGTLDGFVAKFSPSGSTLDYSTYLGGISDDQGNAIVVDANENAYVTGHTSSSDFPTQAAYDASFNFLTDAFVTKLSAAGNTLVYSTYLGGSDADYGEALSVDVDGNAYITGYTQSGDFSTQSPYDAIANGNNDAFVAGLSADGSALNFSTYLGGSDDDRGYAIVVDSAGNVYVSGWTLSSDYPTVNPYDASHNSNSDVFVTRFTPAGNVIDFSTFIGGSAMDVGRELALDAVGSVFVVGEAWSSGFPVLGGYDASFNGTADAFVLKLFNDEDSDGIADLVDNCPAFANPLQEDGDSDGIGDVCDSLVITVYSPVDILVINPSGTDSIGPNGVNTLGTFAAYDSLTDYGLGPNGVPAELDDRIVIFAPEAGQYLIKIIAEPGAAGDYFLGVRDPGGNVYGVRDPGGNVADEAFVAMTANGPELSYTPIANPVPPQGEPDELVLIPVLQRRGDLNDDGIYDIQDVVGIVAVAFRGGALPDPDVIADINGDGIATDVQDVVRLIEHVFRGGIEPGP